MLAHARRDPGYEKYLGDANRIVLLTALRDRRVYLFSVLPRHSVDYSNFKESICREEILEDKPDGPLPSPLVRDEEVDRNGEDSDISS